MSMSLRFVVGAIVILVAHAASAQAPVRERGSAVDVESRWVSSPNGDQRIVSTVVVQTTIDHVAVEIEGGTVGDLTLRVSHSAPIPAVGDTVWLERNGHGPRLFVDDFASFATWPSASVGWVLNPRNDDGVSAELVDTDTRSAAEAWTLQSTAAFAMVMAARTTGGSIQNDGINHVFFRPDTNDLALASTYCWSNLGTLKDCDIVIWDGRATVYPSSLLCVKAGNGIYLRDVLTHEFGHFAGLSHTTVTGATMYPGYAGCSSTQRSLEADDIAGIEALYPATSVPPPSTEEPPRPCKKKGRYACQ